MGLNHSNVPAPNFISTFLICPANKIRWKMWFKKK